MSKVYLILGASSDIGCKLVKKINETDEGALIYAHYHTHNSISTIAKMNGNEIVPIKADLSTEEGVNEILKAVMGKNRIPNAVIHLPAPKLEFIKFKDLAWSECEKDIVIQVSSVFKILQKLLPQMIKLENRSKVVFILSENTVQLPAKYSTKYTMSKYLLLGLMESLTAEYMGKKININAVSPSMVNTKLLSKIDPRMLEISGATGKMLLPENVVPKIMWLLSSDSDDMYGQNIYIPGKEEKDE